MACPLWPLHLCIIYIMAMCPFWLMFTGIASAAGRATWWNVTYFPEKVEKIVEDTDYEVRFWTHQPLGSDFRDGTLELLLSDASVASFVDGAAVNGSSSSDDGGGDADVTYYEVSQIPGSEHTSSKKVIYLNASAALTDLPLNLSFVVRGQFLGYTDVRARASTGPKAPPLAMESDPLSVSVIRQPRTVDKVFVYAVIILMALNYVNMGSSLDLQVVKSTLRRPIGPVVGILSQYIFMPLIAFGLSYVFFHQPALRLGLFTSGCSPGGGASNMWTYLLGGNLNLSITMTFFSNIFAFATMPFWLFTLGRVVFQESKINIPYLNIVSYVVSLVIPVGIGIVIQLYLPRVSNVCRKILGPFSMAMIVFIVVFGVYTNLFMFEVFTWQIFGAGLLVPFLGYTFGALVARLLRFPAPDITAISIETGVQNTGVAIILLRLTLPQPEADLTSVVPVALATMTPIPLLMLMIYYKIRKHMKGRDKKYTLAPTSSPTPSDEEAAAKVNNGCTENGSSPTVPIITINGPRSDYRY